MSKNKTTKSTKKTKKKYKLRNWKEYNEALKNRGRIELWVDKKTLKEWKAKAKKRKRGAQKTYSDSAINLTLQLGKVFHQKLRQTEGLVRSLFSAMGIKLRVPDYSTLSRRGSKLVVNIPKDKNKDNLVIVADSSGLKVYGEGEWKVRKHGYSKHRTWRKFHVAITPDGEIRTVELTENSVTDSEAFLSLIDQEEKTIDKFKGDGGYDTRKVYDKCRQRNITEVIIPPQRNAKIFQHGNCKSPSHPRDKNLRQIRKTSRTKWKEDSDYHVRSLVETTMFRLKTTFGDKLNARKFENQVTEARIMASALNKMMSCGMPDSYTEE